MASAAPAAPPTPATATAAPTARSPRRPRGRRRAVLAATVAVAAMTAGAAAVPTVPAARPDAVQQRLDALVRQDGMPAALAGVTDRGGRTRHYTAGVADLTTGRQVPRDGRVRIGSNTKAFTAVVVLQLAGEGRIRLDASVDTYLPGLLRGDGTDGRRITVRRLLQHTSGLPDYLDQGEVIAHPRRYLEPRALLDTALAREAEFPPGARWQYSNTNYLVAGLIVQKVTGRPLGEEITRRVIDRIGLRHTSFPAPGDMTLPGRHPRGYHRPTPEGPLRDFTELDPSWAWAAGAMVSTDGDLNRFYTALFAGRLLPAAQLAEMRTTVPADQARPGLRYGLGVMSRPLSCGGVYWGHGGTIPGYETLGGVTEDGRSANVTVTAIPTETGRRHLEAAVDTALCG
ncbi:serine hydrolase domain-containing protein [Streptomyces sp. NPDC018031]|uniref:serine hydrolase domain-containing protein n=1 Tax=Streptomyces sp. NPDC018031 TaxID=3365033 RepID=UPI00378D5A42